MAAPAPVTGPRADSPPPMLRAAGLAALLAIVAIDAFTDWSPNIWVYFVGVALTVWGPSVLKR